MGLRSVLSNIGTGVPAFAGNILGEFAANRIAQTPPVAAPSPVPVGSLETGGKYFIPPGAEAAYTQWYQNEVYKQKLLESLFGKVGINLDLTRPTPPAEIIGSAEERLGRQATALGERERAKAVIEPYYETARKYAEFNKDVEIANITADRLRDVALMEQLGKIRSEQEQGKYRMVGNVLDQAIQSVLGQSYAADPTIVSSLASSTTM